MLHEQVHFGFCSSPAISKNVIVVPDNYTKISWAVGNASEGDTILVRPNTYYESNIVVNKTVTIVGENPETTLVDGASTMEGIFFVTRSNVMIENLTIQNTSSTGFVPAVWLSNVENVTVRKVKIRNAVYGVEIKSSNFTKILYSRISETFNCAIYVWSKSYSSTIVGNTLESNPTAIIITDVESKFSKIYHNNFINNTQPDQVWFNAISYFDNDYPSGGNYWSNHAAPDLKSGPYPQNQNGSDGILDESYPSGVSLPWDKYPLAHPLTTLEVAAEGECFEVQVSTNSSLNSYNFSIEAKKLTLFLNGTESTNGSCRVSIPKRLLSCEPPSQWNVSLYNGEQITYLAQEDGDNTYLYFAYNHSSTGEIKIKGTKAIPEFPNITVLIILLTIVTLATAIFKAKLIKMNKKINPELSSTYRNYVLRLQAKPHILRFRLSTFYSNLNME